MKYSKLPASDGPAGESRCGCQKTISKCEGLGHYMSYSQNLGLFFANWAGAWKTIMHSSKNDNICSYTKTWKTMIHSSQIDDLELYSKYWPWPISQYITIVWISFLYDLVWSIIYLGRTCFLWWFWCDNKAPRGMGLVMRSAGDVESLASTCHRSWNRHALLFLCSHALTCLGVAKTMVGEQ